MNSGRCFLSGIQVVDDRRECIYLLSSARHFANQNTRKVMLKKTLSLLALLAWALPGLMAQIETNYIRDSIEIERGVAGTGEFEPFFRLINESFDADNRPLRSVIYRYVTANEWVPDQRQTFTYDEEGNTTLFLLEEWDEAGETWLPLKQEESTYENGRLVTFLRQKGMNGELQNNRRWFYEYNANGRETGKLLQSWNPATATWSNLTRKITAYDAEGHILTQRLERFEEGNWINRRRRLWTWEAGMMQPSETLSQVWSAEEATWVNFFRKTYGMTPNGLWSGTINEEWDPVGNEWVRKFKQTFAINLAGNSTSFFKESWFNDEWQPVVRSQYNYSAAENTALLQGWNATEEAYENYLRHRSLFNEDRLPEQLTGMQAWNTDAGSWRNEDFTRRITYFWREAGTSATEGLSFSPCAIPNPYSSGATINCAEAQLDFPLQLEVYNLYGQLLLHEPVYSSTFRVATDGLPSGLYLFQLSDQQRAYQVNKVVVSR